MAKVVITYGIPIVAVIALLYGGKKLLDYFKASGIQNKLEEDRKLRNKLLFFRQTIDSIIDKVKGKTIVVFDTETTGLSVLLPWVQVTEIAAVAIDADTGKELSFFHKKIKLTPDTRAEINREREASSPSDSGAREGPKSWNIQRIFKQSRYGDKNTQFDEIKNVYQEWVDWLNQFDKPVMVAQNAAFDMTHMFAPLKKLNIPRPKVGEVLDTMVLARTWIYPLLKAASAAGDEASEKILAAFEVERNGRKTQSFTLQNIGKAFNVPAEHWHSGKSDTKQTLGVLQGMLQFLADARMKNLETSDIFKKWHAKMSKAAFYYGKQPARQQTVKSVTAKGKLARSERK
jgi:DNA polymerase III alpha subunit (gram-positive type)